MPRRFKEAMAAGLYLYKKGANFRTLRKLEVKDIPRAFTQVPPKADKPMLQQDFAPPRIQNETKTAAKINHEAIEKVPPKINMRSFTKVSPKISMKWCTKYLPAINMKSFVKTRPTINMKPFTMGLPQINIKWCTKYLPTSNMKVFTNFRTLRKLQMKDMQRSPTQAHSRSDKPMLGQESRREQNVTKTAEKTKAVEKVPPKFSMRSFTKVLPAINMKLFTKTGPRINMKPYTKVLSQVNMKSLTKTLPNVNTKSFIKALPNVSMKSFTKALPNVNMKSFTKALPNVNIKSFRKALPTINMKTFAKLKPKKDSDLNWKACLNNYTSKFAKVCTWHKSRAGENSDVKEEIPSASNHSRHVQEYIQSLSKEDLKSLLKFIAKLVGNVVAPLYLSFMRFGEAADDIREGDYKWAVIYITLGVAGLKIPVTFLVKDIAQLVIWILKKREEQTQDSAKNDDRSAQNDLNKFLVHVVAKSFNETRFTVDSHARNKKELRNMNDDEFVQVSVGDIIYENGTTVDTRNGTVSSNGNGMSLKIVQVNERDFDDRGLTIDSIARFPDYISDMGIIQIEGTYRALNTTGSSTTDVITRISTVSCNETDTREEIVQVEASELSERGSTIHSVTSNVAVSTNKNNMSQEIVQVTGTEFPEIATMITRNLEAFNNTDGLNDQIVKATVRELIVIIARKD